MKKYRYFYHYIITTNYTEYSSSGTLVSTPNVIFDDVREIGERELKTKHELLQITTINNLGGVK